MNDNEYEINQDYIHDRIIKTIILNACVNVVWSQYFTCCHPTKQRRNLVVKSEKARERERERTLDFLDYSISTIAAFYSTRHSPLTLIYLTLYYMCTPGSLTSFAFIASCSSCGTSGISSIPPLPSSILHICSLFLNPVTLHITSPCILSPALYTYLSPAPST